MVTERIPTDPDELPILHLASKCENLFTSALNSINTTDEAPMLKRPLEELQSRFWDWESYLGVFASKKTSLDGRLRGRTEYRDLVLLTLDMLRVNLFQLLPSKETSLGPGSDDSDDSDPDDSGSQNIAFEGIHDAICQLDRLAISIRQSSTSNLTRRVKAFAARKTDFLNTFETAALLMVKSLYPDAAESLHRQLSKSMTDRYARLLYWKSHDKKMRTDSRLYAQSQPISSQTALPTPLEAAPRTFVSPGSGQAGPALRQRYIRGQQPVSETEPSTAFCQARITHLPKRPGEGASSVQINKVEYPRPPKLKDNEQASCEFCRKIHSKEQYDDTDWWRRHVNSDLLPFICLSEICQDFPAFTEYRDWVAHMANEHGKNWPRDIHERLPWKCDRQDGDHKTTQLFSSFDQLKAHWKTEHGENTAYEREAGDLDAELYLIRQPNVCPLCSLPIEKTDAKATVTSPVAEKWPAVLSTGEEAKSSEKVKRAPDLESEQQEMSPDGDKSLESQHDQGGRTNLQLASTISRHVASHLQFLTFLTLRLFASKLVEGEEHHFDSAAASGAKTDASGERSTLKDHVTETEDPKDLGSTPESSQGSIIADPNDTDSLYTPPLVTDETDQMDWKDFNIEPRENNRDPIKHMGKIQQLLELLSDVDLVLEYDNSIMSTALRQAEVYDDPGNNNSFIPLDAQDKIISRTAIEGFFSQLVKFCLAEVPESDTKSVVVYCTDQVWNPLPYCLPESDEEEMGSRKKLFAILTLIDKPAAILSFIKERVSDLDLPVHLCMLGDEGRNFGIESGTGRKLECFSDWTMMEMAAFVNLPVSNVSNMGTRSLVPTETLRSNG
ncbi:hypothetical protein V8E54_006779 [Elaphomyces granulatus]